MYAAVVPRLACVEIPALFLTLLAGSAAAAGDGGYGVVARWPTLFDSETLAPICVIPIFATVISRKG